MQYCVKNQLHLFEFHDSVFSFVRFDQTCLVVSAKYLNIHKEAKENPEDCDMEIDSAEISFNGIENFAFKWMEEYEPAVDGTLYMTRSSILFRDKEAENRFMDALKRRITVDGIEICEDKNGKDIIRIYTHNCFLVEFTFESVLIRWDTYSKKAWYEQHKQYTYEIMLLTPNGGLKTKMYLVYYKGEMDCPAECAESFTVHIGIQFNGKEIWGHGRDYLWSDAFADLQKQLPAGVLLKCCMTCRHGNMCPYGNTPGNLFCTKDLTIASKEAVCCLFDYSKDSDIRKRLRNCADSCDDFECQSWDYYTYNDYLYELGK